MEMEEKEAKGETTTSKDASDSEDESEILEESPCGRWQKRREEVRDRQLNRKTDRQTNRQRPSRMPVTPKMSRRSWRKAPVEDGKKEENR